jgi:hypothetical protein
MLCSASFVCWDTASAHESGTWGGEENVGALRPEQAAGGLGADIRHFIEAARIQVAQSVNAGLVLLNWQIGNRIRRDILAEARAEYGEQIVSTLSRQLTTDYGAGFSRQNLFHMIRFVEAWPDHAAVSALAQHLGWSHFKEIFYLENQLARQFYAEMCRLERWSVRTLRERVRSMLFERTAISRLPEEAIRQDLEQLRVKNRRPAVGTPNMSHKQSRPYAKSKATLNALGRGRPLLLLWFSFSLACWVLSKAPLQSGTNRYCAIFCVQCQDVFTS